MVCGILDKRLSSIYCLASAVLSSTVRCFMNDDNYIVVVVVVVVGVTAVVAAIVVMGPAHSSGDNGKQHIET